MTDDYGCRGKCRWLAALCLTWLMVIACASPALPPDAATFPNPTPPNKEEQPALGSCTLGLPTSTTDEAAIAQVLQAEGDLVVRQEIERLMQLWHDGAMIIDAKQTPTDENDDQRWLDKDAIRHRYVRIVFPGAPAVAAPKDLIVRIEGMTAIITATTQIGDEVSPGGDRWQLSKEGDCWAIDHLTYNLETP